MVRSAHFLAKLVLLCLVDIFEILQLSDNKKNLTIFLALRNSSSAS